MLVCSVMWFACLMACATSSFMSVHFPAKIASVFVYLNVCVFVMGRYLHKYWTVNGAPRRIYHLKQYNVHTGLLGSNWPICPWEKNDPVHYIWTHFLSLSFFFTQNPLPHKRITPLLLSSCLHRALYLSLCKYFRHCTRHESHFNLHPHCSSFPLGPTLFAAGPKINKQAKEAKRVPVRCLKINTTVPWWHEDVDLALRCKRVFLIQWQHERMRTKRDVLWMLYK